MFLESALGQIGPLYIAAVISDFEYKLANEDGSTFREGNKELFHDDDLGFAAAADPVATDPTATDPATTDPATTDPAATDPATTNPAATDPTTADPTATDPVSGSKAGAYPKLRKFWARIKNRIHKTQSQTD